MEPDIISISLLREELNREEEDLSSLTDRFVMVREKMLNSRPQMEAKDRKEAEKELFRLLIEALKEEISASVAKYRQSGGEEAKRE